MMIVMWTVMMMITIMKWNTKQRGHFDYYKGCSLVNQEERIEEQEKEEKDH